MKKKKKKDFRRVVQVEFNRLFVMAKENYEKFNKSTICWLCEKPFQKGDVKVKDYECITGKFMDQNVKIET